MGNCSKILEFINGVQKRSGNDLLHFVELYAKDDVIKDFLKYTYDTKKYVYGVSVKTIYEYDLNPKNCDWIRLVGAIEYLDKERTNSYDTFNIVVDIIDEFGIIAYTILNRKIPNASLGPASINKVIPKLITEFKVMKAKDLVWSKFIETNNYYVERKYDGNNLYIIEGKFYTREGHRVYLPHLEPDVKHVPGVMIVECCVEDGKLGTRSKVQGLITKGRKRTISVHEQEQLQFYCIDYIHKDYWDRKFCATHYVDRLTALKSVVLVLPTRYDLVFKLEVTSKAEAKRFLARELDLGYEGVVIKPKYFYYKWKRDWDWMRYKEAKTADLKVIAWEYGTGVNSTRLGSLVCTGTINNQFVKVNIGQGFKDHEREIAFADAIVGKIIEVTYNEVTPEGSLTIPIYVGIRADKEDNENA